MIQHGGTAPLLLRNVRPIGFGQGQPGGKVDVLIGADGRVAEVGGDIASDARAVETGGAYLSPGWTDLHTHIWHGGTDFSLKPADCGIKRGVTTVVDAGSAGEANFLGLREFIIEPAQERVRAFLNIGSIGLVAANRVSELIDMRSIDIDRMVACVEKHRDVIVGIKCRASGVILGPWGITPVKLAKKIAKVLKLPLMVHVGEPPPLYDEVLEILGPGDIITHCFNGKVGGSVLEDEDLFQLAVRCADEGVLLDIGHGAASFSFEVGEAAIARGLLPFSISTDLHQRSLDGPVWDLGTTMAKLMSVGMSLDQVVNAVTRAPNSVIGVPVDGRLDMGSPAEFTVFDVVDSDVSVRDSLGHPAHLKQMIEPRWTVLGPEAFPASRHLPHATDEHPAACPNCGWKLR